MEAANAYQWAITTHGRLYVPDGNHLYSGDQPDREEVVDIDDVGEDFLKHQSRLLCVELMIRYRRI